MDFDASIEEELARSLRSGVFPVKLAYLGPGADNHRAYSATEGYAQSAGDARATADFLSVIFKDGGWDRYAVAELGPGAGHATVALLTRLAVEGVPPEAYFCADLSEDLLVMTAERVAAEGLAVPVATALCDIESEGGLAAFAQTIGSTPARLLGLFVGVTIGNVENPEGVLSRIRRELPTVRDWIITCALRDPKMSGAQIAAPYQNEAKYRNVSQSLLNAGVPKRSFRVETVFDEVLSAIVSRAIFEEPAAVHFGGSTYHFEPGQAVRCSLSRRFEPQTFEVLLHTAGFSVAHSVHLNGGALGCFHAVHAGA